jgi:hypothetical protein
MKAFSRTNGLSALLADAILSRPVKSSRQEFAQVTPYSLVDGSTYQKGCFLPCLCSISPELSVVGTFGLVKLQEGLLFTEYAVVNIVWTVVSADGTIDGLDQGVSIAGTGIFRIGGKFASQQQLSLDLSIDGGPLTHFDSGLVR